MNSKVAENVHTFDQEWVSLILEAKNMGIPYEDVQNFLKQSGAAWRKESN